MFSRIAPSGANAVRRRRQRGKASSGATDAIRVRRSHERPPSNKSGKDPRVSPRMRCSTRSRRQRRDKRGDIAAQHGNFLDQARGDELVRLAGHQEHRLDIRRHAVVHAGHLEFIVEIRHRAQPAHDHRCAHLAGEIDQQRVERHDLDHHAVARGDRGYFGAHQFHPLLQAEHRALAGADRHAHHQSVQQPSRSGDHVEVTVGDRIEGPRVETDPPWVMVACQPSLPSSGAAVSPLFVVWTLGPQDLSGTPRSRRCRPPAR